MCLNPKTAVPTRLPIQADYSLGLARSEFMAQSIYHHLIS